MIKNNKFRINQASLKHPLTSRTVETTLKTFFSKAIVAVKEKAANAYAKLEGKLTDTPAVFSVGKDERPRQLSVQQMPRDRDYSLSKNSEILKGRAKSNLTGQDSEKLKQLMSRKQQLMQKLRRIDYQLLNPAPTAEMRISRVSVQSPLKQLESRLKMQQNRVYNPSQHEKTIEMLARLNNQKIRRQERIVQDMKRKQEQEIKKLSQIENKSHLKLSRRTPTPLIKFNSKETQTLAFDRKTNSVAESHLKTSEKIQNEFEELPELITCEKPVEQQQPVEEQSII